MGRQVENLQINFLKKSGKKSQKLPERILEKHSISVSWEKESQTQIWLKDTQGEGKKSNIPNYMNAFFTEIGPKLARDHTERWDYYGETVINDIPPFHLGNRSWCGHPNWDLMPG